MNAEIAKQILLRAFPSDSEVAAVIAEQIAHDRYPFSASQTELWKLVVDIFKNNTTVVQPIDDWATKAKQNEMELRYAGMVGRTPTIYARIPSSKFARVLSDQLAHPSMNDFHVRESIQGPVQRRIKRDSEVRNALVEVLRRGESADGKATFPRVLAGASVLDEQRLD
jgi:hypothetical protein